MVDLDSKCTMFYGWISKRVCFLEGFAWVIFVMFIIVDILFLYQIHLRVVTSWKKRTGSFCLGQVVVRDGGWKRQTRECNPEIPRHP